MKTIDKCKVKLSEEQKKKLGLRKQKRKQNEKIIKHVQLLSKIAAIFMLVLTTLSIMWMFKTWKNLTASELFFQLQAPVEGTSADIIVSYVFWCIILSAVITALVVLLYKKMQIKVKQILTMCLGCCFLITAIMVGYMWNRLDLSAFFSGQQTYSNFIDGNYVAPDSVKISFPEKKRNLVYIYLESMENTYADKKSGGAFDKNVIKELTALSNKYENFSGDHSKLNGGIPLNYAMWTVAAMFSQSSGLPLKTPVDGNTMNEQSEFFPGITMIGDILKEEGYNQGILLGSRAEFGGRNLLYSQHGDYSIWDYYYSQKNGEIDPDYQVFWGYEDQKLFEFAKQHLEYLSKDEEPFNFTMLTVDTHFEDGYKCAICPDTYGGDKYSNAIACSSKQVTDFVKWIQKQDFYEDTTIVISGDHLTMDGDYCDDVDSSYDRKVFTTYINAPIVPQDNSYREYSTFDNFPTTLAALGVEIEGNRLGLGTNLFSGEQTLVEKYTPELINSELLMNSRFIEENTDNLVLKVPIGGISNEEAPTAEVVVEEYDYRKGYFNVDVSNITGGVNLQSLRCKVENSDTPNSTEWFEEVISEDGTAQFQIDLRAFAYMTGMYDVEVYVVNSQGENIQIGAVQEYIE